MKIDPKREHKLISVPLAGDLDVGRLQVLKKSDVIEALKKCARSRCAVAARECSKYCSDGCRKKFADERRRERGLVRVPLARLAEIETRLDDLEGLKTVLDVKGATLDGRIARLERIEERLSRLEKRLDERH